jgi:7-keto-8-aminopelargonate synthetase-like enzyme
MNLHTRPHLEIANKMIEQGIKAGIMQKSVLNTQSDGKTVILEDGMAIYFGNCSYLALENDIRLKEAAKAAIDRYGIQFACSRSYASLSMYEEMEYLMSEIFGKPTIVAPTTTLAHLSTIPVLVSAKDAIIFDHLVHASVQNAIWMVKAGGTHVELIRHNRMDMLEDRIKELSAKHSRIWFMADGVYSMFGDAAPMKELWNLMERYENFYVYIDDAHGMSWTGKHGSGYALSQLPHFHDKMILVTSLVKGFGCSGGAIVVPDKEIKQLLLNIGPSLMFSGPVMPAVMGAIIASAKIHLSDEITILQQSLVELIRHFNNVSEDLNLPLIIKSENPIFFIGVGSLKNGLSIGKELLDKGFLLNISSYPAVPYKNSGLRAILTLHHDKQDITEMLHVFADILNNMEDQKRINRTEIHNAFKSVALIN